MDITKLPKHIIEDIRANGHSPEDMATMSVNELFEAYCNGNGIIRWADTLRETIDALRAAAEEPQERDDFDYERGDTVVDRHTGQRLRVERRLIDADTDQKFYQLRRDSDDREVIRNRKLVDNSRCFYRASADH